MKSILSIVLTLSSVSAFAQNQCLQNFQESARKCDGVLYQQIMAKHGKVVECKTVQWINQRNEAGNLQSVDESVVMLAKNGLAIVNNLDQGSCKVRYMAITDTAQEAKAVNGRVIIRSVSGRLYAITRTGSVKELMNNSNDRYFGVKDIKVEGDVVQIKHKSTETLTSRELFDRVNSVTKSEIVGM